MKSRFHLLAWNGVASVMLCLLLAQSVAEGGVEASKTDPNEPMKAFHQAERTMSVPVRIPSTTKKKYPYLAQNAVLTTQKALLPVADQASFTDTHKKLSDTVLRALPSHCRTHLKNYYIQYQGAKNRGLGGKTTIILDGSVPDKEFIGLLVHECAHVTHSNLIGNASAGPSAFKDGKETFYADSPIAAFFSISWSTENVLKRGIRKADFVSGYAQSDAFEDFAETFAAYALHRPMLRERAKDNVAIAAKLQWMETYLPMQENMFGTSTYTWNKAVPWDVTRLPYSRN